MNVILKPGGLMLLLIAFATVSTAAILTYKKQNPALAPIILSKGSIANTQLVNSADGSVAPPDDEELAADNWRMIGQPSQFTVAWKKGPNDQYPKAKEYTIKTKPKAGSWEIQIYQPIEDALPAGAQIQVRFWARSKDNGAIAAVIEQQAAPYNRLTAKEISLSPQWRSFTVETQTTRALPSGWAKVGLQLAARPSVIEIAGADVIVVKKP